MPAPFARGSNAFGLDLYRRLPPQGNQIISPASVSIALTMAWAGARGETAEQMQAVLRQEEPATAAMQAALDLAKLLRDQKRSVRFRLANRLFGEQSYRFERAFVEAVLEAVSFKTAPESARGRINDWVAEQTEQRIRDLLPPGAIDDETRLVLVNAIYFLGEWLEPFPKQRTFDAPFHPTGAPVRKVPTMHHAAHLPCAALDGFKALALPYKDRDLSMLLLLPDSRDGLPALERSLAAEELDVISAKLARKLVALALPKFELKPAESLSLGQALHAMGMTLPFDRECADFRGIADPPDPRERLCFDGVYHKGFVKVDEKGTEAAVATAVAMVPGMSQSKPVEFNADHPFLFFVRHEPSGAVLFMGRVSDPSLN